MSNEMIFTVGDLQDQLKSYSRDTKLFFDGDLTFSRMKRWGDNGVYLLFSEPQAHLDDRFIKRNPNVKVAFIKDDGLGHFDVSLD